MIILSTDTSIGSASVCLSKDGKIISSSEEETYSMQSETLFSHIEKVLDDANLDYDNVDYFCATIGPGSFTGIRIGMSAFKAAALALNKKFIGITTLEAMAENAFAEGLRGNITCLIKAGRNQAYTQLFNISDENIEQASDAEATDYENLKIFEENSNYIVTNFNDVAKEYLSDGKLYKDNLSSNAIYAAKHLERLLKNEDNDLKDRTSPIYIRDADAKKANIKTRIVG